MERNCDVKMCKWAHWADRHDTANATHHMDDWSKWSHSEFATCIPIECILLTLLIYFTVSLLHYGWKYGRFHRKNASDFNGGTVFVILLTAPALSTIRVASTIIGEFMTIYEPGHDQFCDRLYKVSAILFYLGIAPVFYVLWMRQRVLYDHPFMSGINHN